jgi:type I restriction enzyme R subunit
MLLTGFDAPIEQALYLDRPIRDAELLQAIARVNRPAREKREGLVVDYYGVLNNLGVALAAYRGNRHALDSMRSMSDEVPGMGRAAKHVEDFLASMGIDGADLRSRGGLSKAVFALKDTQTRAEFDRRLGEFLGAVDRVLPHQEALERLAEARLWSVLQMRLRRHYRDEPGGDFSMRGYGRKVRALIADHLEVQKIEQSIAPVSLLHPDFDEIVGRLPVREAAAEQVQALRYHLEERIEQDERRLFRQLSAELERVLEEFDGRWEEIKEKLGPLVDRARRAEEADPYIADLSPMEQLLYVLLGEKLASDPRFVTPEPSALRHLAVALREEIVSHVTKAFYDGQDGQMSVLESHLIHRLRREKLRAIDGKRDAIEKLAGLVASHATRHLEGFRAEGRRQ